MGSTGSAHLARDNCNNIRPALTELNARIRDLAPALNTPSFVWTFNPRLDTALKQTPDGAVTIMALQNSGNSGSYDFALPPQLCNVHAITVAYENRTIAPDAKGCKFTDSFSAEYAYHIYKVPAGAAAQAGG